MDAAVSGLARVPQLRTLRRFFTLTRRKKAGDAPSGETLTFIGVHIADFDALWIAHNFIIWINRSNTMSHPCDG